MNERINQLRLEAGISRLHDEPKFMVAVSKEGTVIEPLDGLEKFAELIVADCLKQIKDGLVDESELLYEHEETTECVNEALMDAHHNIAIHFGFAEQFGVEL